MKRIIVWSLVALLALLFFDKCTPVNVFSAFKRSDFKHLPDLRDGAVSANYQLQKMSDETHNNIVYDPAGNYFLIESNFDVKKIDANGNEIFKIKKTDMYVPRFTSYVFDSTGVYDLSVEKIEKHRFTKINQNQTLTVEEWQAMFDKLYHEAEVVLFGYTDMFGKNNPVFVKIKGSWIVLIMTQHEARLKEIEYVTGIRFEGYPAKYKHLYLLKDAAKQTYSNFESTSDEWLHSFNGMDLRERGLSYPTNRKIKTLDYKKTGVDADIAYTPIPISWLCSTSQSLSIDGEELRFNCGGTIAVGFFNEVKSYLRWYSVPEKYSSKTLVSFLSSAFYSNEWPSKNDGLYIIKRKG
jgi:hypothetical protein